MAKENSGCGYDRIAGALPKLAMRFRIKTCAVSTQALKRTSPNAANEPLERSHPFPQRRARRTGLLTCKALATYYLLFAMKVETRRLHLAGVARHRTEAAESTRLQRASTGILT